MNHTFQRIHIIAIGGAVMSSLAVALKNKNLIVSGADDHIYDPAASLLQSNHLYPPTLGWDIHHITDDLDAVIVGMHAKPDNLELIEAQKRGIKVYSYPEYIRLYSENKQRIVIAGSHGKTTITGMIIHILEYYNRSFDYLVGAKITGLDATIRLTDAPIIIIEGDEYLTSPLDTSPKFLQYDYHIALISGIEWDHVNVYPTAESYLLQFYRLADQSPKAGTIIYCAEDKLCATIGKRERNDVITIPYKTPTYSVKGGKYYFNKSVPLQIFGKHNMQNLAGAIAVLSRIGINKKQCLAAIPSFGGAYKRNNLIAEGRYSAIYNDFAHAPSKLKATVEGLKELHPQRKLTACYELHTFSSLKKEFLSHYKNTFASPNEAIVYVDSTVLAAKNNAMITGDEIRKAFNRKDIILFRDSSKLKDHLLSQEWQERDLIFMSSGNFGALDLLAIANQIIN